MAEKKKADGPTWALRVGIALAVVAVLQAGNELTRDWGHDYHSAARTGALALVLVVGAFAARAWQAMDRDGGDE